MDELFEAMTLVQTQKVTAFPIVLVDSSYWGGLLDWLRDRMVGDGKASEQDLQLLQVVDDGGRGDRSSSAWPSLMSPLCDGRSRTRCRSRRRPSVAPLAP